jgi:hypothetical protein
MSARKLDCRLCKVIQFCVISHNFERCFSFSVIRLIQQYLKESNLIRTLQTLQVTTVLPKLTVTSRSRFVEYDIQ